jgi:hypothetical protein
VPTGTVAVGRPSGGVAAENDAEGAANGTADMATAASVAARRHPLIPTSGFG